MKASSDDDESAWLEKLRLAFPLANLDELLASRPMRFGTEFDFRLAVAELKWLKDKHGRVTDDDLRQASMKYQIPKRMLADGLEDRLKHPRDFMIGSSPWFPVLYSWAVGDEVAQYDLLLKRVRQEHASFNFVTAELLVPLVVGAIALVLWNTLQSFGYSFWDIMKSEAFLLAAIPFYIALLINLRHRIEDNWRVARDQISKMYNEGRGAIVQGLLQFLRSKPGSDFLSSSFFLRKSDDDILASYKRRPHFYGYYLGLVEVTRNPSEESLSRPSIRRFIRKGVKPARSSLENEVPAKVPLFVDEDPHKAYRERMKAILAKTEPENSKV